MADKKITDLSAAAALDGTELIECVQGGANVKTTPAAILSITGANFRFMNGQLQFWDPTAATSDPTKPWRALGVDNGATVWSNPIAN